MVTHRFPWAYGQARRGFADAKHLRASGELGLGILQSLRWDEAEVRAVALPAVTTLASLDNLYETECARLKSITPLAILKTIISKLRLPNMVNLARLNLVPDTQPPGGTDLKGFLRSYLSTHPKAEICVTGHSMGGAMSPTLALWLADTRGTPKRSGSMDFGSENSGACMVVCRAYQEDGHSDIATTDIDFGAAPRRITQAGRRHRYGRDYHGAVHFLGEALQPCGNISGLTEKLKRRPIARSERAEHGGPTVDADAETQRRLDVACEFGTDLIDVAPYVRRRHERLLGSGRCVCMRAEHAHNTVAGDAYNVAAIGQNGGTGRLHVAIDDEQRVEWQAPSGKPYRVRAGRCAMP